MGALVGGVVAAVLSLLVLSRAIADNPGYRLAQYLLVGVALGAIAAVLVNQTLVPAVDAAIFGTASLDRLIVLALSAVLALLLAARYAWQQGSYLANVPLAVLLGIGAALALVGAVRGTIVPQLLDTVARRRLDTLDPATLAGTATLIVTLVVTLLAFSYTRRGEQQGAMDRGLRGLGRSLILAAFGFFLAVTVRTYIAALVAQIQAIADWLTLVANQF